MKNLEQQFSEDLLMTQSSKSVREYSDPIPLDLLIDIFSRVPAKSIARFRCVSKFWESILRRPDFTELFLTKSSTHPRLFFTVKVNEELLVFSSPQPQNPNKNSSLVATRYKSFPKSFPTQVYTLVNGLVFLQDWDRKAQVICNPATGESITLPKVKATGIGSSYLGFDPISKQFKVLCMILLGYERPNTHRVLTLETGKCLWRTIQDPLPHHSRFNSEICINGVLYYAAYIEGSDKIVCFDFRFEKFSLINMDRYMVRDHCQLTLLNNKGKLCACYRNGEKLVLWVLEDAGKHKWSKSKCVLLKIFNMYKIVGMTGTGEIVFTSHWLLNPFYIFYYHIQGKTLTRVNIKGFEELECHPIIFSFLDYVESIKFM